MKIILGTAHLKSTPGKCSPDKKLFEYKYSRELVKAIYSIFKNMGYDVYIDIEDEDLNVVTNQELRKRVNIVNTICDKYPDSIYVSIHVNAAGDGSKWMNARGWECYTTKGITKSDKLAECLYKSAEKNLKNQTIRRDLTDGDSDKEADFYVIKNVKCPAVLTENFFMDNKEDVQYLLSDVGFQELTRTHVEGILSYIL